MVLSPFCRGSNRVSDTRACQGILLLLMERHSLRWWWWEELLFFFSPPSKRLRRGGGPVQSGWETAPFGSIGPGIPGPQQEEPRDPTGSVSWGLMVGEMLRARTFSFAHLHLGDLCFSSLEINVLYFFFFFLKVHLLNPWRLSFQTILYHVINPLGVPFRSNDILWFFFFLTKSK